MKVLIPMLALVLAVGCTRDTDLGRQEESDADPTILDSPDAHLDPVRIERSEFAAGCSSDDDCAIVREDCCGCTAGGTSTAVLKRTAGAWGQLVSLACAPTGVGPHGCPAVYWCDQVASHCIQGSCEAAGYQVLNTPCAPGEVYNDNRSCGMPQPDAGVSCGAQYGDLRCYQRCLSDSDCRDPSKPYCRNLGFFAGYDYSCNRRILVCRDTPQHQCP